MRRSAVQNSLSNQQEYVDFLRSILSDVEAIEGLDLTRDAQTIAHRTTLEGLSFLTKTLPAFYKQILTFVEVGQLSPLVGFKHDKKGPLPCFLRGLVSQLFSEDGRLRQDRSPYALGYIGQICTVLYKCEFPYTQAQLEKRLEKFVAVESELQQRKYNFDYLDNSSLTLAIFFSQDLHKNWSMQGALPRHGPGAVAGREAAEEKYDFVYSERIDDVFPYDEWFSTQGWEFIDADGTDFQVPVQACRDLLTYRGGNAGGVRLKMSDPLQQLLVDSEGSPREIPPARGIFVNKDSRGPRYISAEPKEHMWLQQGIGESLVKYYEGSCQYTKGNVNFTDQSVNQRLALASSVSGEFATLDMEDASDRVSLALVREVLPSRLVRLLEACRSNSAVLPGEASARQLLKFAPMGSACCFPIESIMFFVLAVARISVVSGLDPAVVSKRVYVYGDDLIVPTMYVDTLVQFFEKMHLRFNRAKCYSKGPFRESCGTDAIDGIIITPIKIRRPFLNPQLPKEAEPCDNPEDREDSTNLGSSDVPRKGTRVKRAARKGGERKSRKRPETDSNTIISLLASSDQLFRAGYWRASDYLLNHLRSRGLTFQYVPPQSGLYGYSGYENTLEVSGRPVAWDSDKYALAFTMNRVKQVKIHRARGKNVPLAWPMVHTAILSSLISLERKPERARQAEAYLGRGAAVCSIAFNRRNYYLKRSKVRVLIS